MNPFHALLVPALRPVALGPLAQFLLHADMTMIIFSHLIAALCTEEIFLKNFIVGITELLPTHFAL